MRGRRLHSARLALMALFAVTLFASSLVANVAPARADAGIEATMFPSRSCTVTPTSSCPMTIRVTNTSTTIASDVIAAVSVSTTPIKTLTDASAWFRAGTAVFRDELALESIEFGDLAPGESVAASTAVSLSVNQVGRSWGLIGLNADIESGGVAAAVTRTAIVWEPTVAPGRTNVSTIVPLVSPADPNSFISATQLDALMSPGGLLYAQLTAASVASGVAVDPRLVASILRAGDKATPAVRDWLTRLQSLSQPSLELQYADADFTLEGQVGFSKTISFGVQDVSSLRDGQLANTWAPSIANAYWAEPNTLTAASLTAVNAAQSSAGSAPVVLFAGSNNADSIDSSHVDLSTSPSATRFDTVVVNDSLTASLRAAESAVTEEQWLRATSEVGAYLAVVAGNGGGHLVAGFSRSLTAGTNYRTAQTQNYIASLPWAQPVLLDAVLELPTQATLLTETQPSDARLAGGASVLSNYMALANFSEAASTPSSVLDAASRLDLPLLSVAWIDQPSRWTEALTGLATSTREYLDTVHFGLTSNINMVGGQASIPITVVNGHPFDVTVVVRAVPSNPRLTVGSEQRVTISAESQGTVKIPVAARVGNGDVDLVLSLWTEGDQPFGTEVTVPVTVRADWEGFGLAIIAVLFVGLVATGVFRTLRRNRVTKKADR